MALRKKKEFKDLARLAKGEIPENFEVNPDPVIEETTSSSKEVDDEIFNSTMEETRDGVTNVMFDGVVDTGDDEGVVSGGDSATASKVLQQGSQGQADIGVSKVQRVHEAIPTANKPEQPEKINPHLIPDDFSQRDFASEKALIRYKVSEVMTLIELGEVPDDTLEQLASMVDNHRHITFDEDYNIRDELHTMMKMVQAVRGSILTSNNQIARDTTVTEVKAVLDASMRLTTLLTKSNKEIINMDRIKAVEAAFLEVISGMDTEVQKSYVDTLESRMKLMKELTHLE